MKSFCIKTNHIDTIDYLLNELENIKLEHVYYRPSQFKLYQNVIIHYTGENTDKFYNILASLLSKSILTFYEQPIMNSILNLNYFYFSEYEKKQILENAEELLESGSNESFIRKENLFLSTLAYIMEHKSILLDGFVNFRIQEYITILDDTIDLAVNKFLIEREYSEFIHLLKLYINSKECETGVTHLIYSNGESILLDDKKNIISITDNIFNAKYLSDITFSSNDYALNTLLTILPEQINIHLLDPKDEFINTLELIFDDRIKFCTDCNLCRTYQLITNKVKN